MGSAFSLFRGDSDNGECLFLILRHPPILVFLGSLFIVNPHVPSTTLVPSTVGFMEQKPFQGSFSLQGKPRVPRVSALHPKP